MKFFNWFYNIFIISSLFFSPIRAMENKEAKTEHNEKLWIDALCELNPLAAGHMLALIAINPHLKFLLTFKQSEVENYFNRYPDLMASLLQSFSIPRDPVKN